MPRLPVFPLSNTSKSSPNWGGKKIQQTNQTNKQTNNPTGYARCQHCSGDTLEVAWLKQETIKADSKN